MSVFSLHEQRQYDGRMAEEGGGGGAAADDDDDNQEKTPGIGWDMSEEGISFYWAAFLSLLALVLIFSKLLHDRPAVASVFPEAGMTILVGMVAGYFIYMFAPPSEVDEDADDDEVVAKTVADGLLEFSPTIFFVAILPPIIFNAGYHLKRELFFRHLKPITLFACLGTAISAIVIAALLRLVQTLHLTGNFQPAFTELVTFGALISATDPVSTLAVFQAKRVDPHLFYLVFGESVLNDAVGLVLFNAVAKFVGNEDDFETVAFGALRFCIDFVVCFVGSLCLGVLTGLLAALLLKKVDMRQTGMLELSLYILIMYLPFFFAEIMQLSGIVTILFTGLAAKRYCEPNLSESTETEADVLFRVSAHIAETGIFLELGLSVFGISSAGSFNYLFIFWAFLACLVGRAANVYPIAFFFNRSIRRTQQESNIKNQTRNHEGVTGSGSRLPSSDDPKPPDAQNNKQERILNTAISEDITVTPSSRKDLKIGINTAHMLWFSGLRGAVAYACAKTFPDHYGNRVVFVRTTMAIVLATVFLMGSTTEMALNALKIDMNVDEDKYMDDQGQRLKLGWINLFETKYICPCVIRDYGLPEADSLDTQSTDNNNVLSSPSMEEDDAAVGASENGITAPSTPNQRPTSPPALEMVPQQSQHQHQRLHHRLQAGSLSPHFSPYIGEEMTISGHMNLMTQMRECDSFRRKKSLYDYGAR